ncbi:hypothetical protein BSKO_06497 [Bryopsis sp. KO-2023]|nr:hypothetical protein BSKO_06497 [Bryopsis sp. KO-2023]
MSVSELACTYAALILHDDGLEISADNLLTLTKSAGIEVEPYWPGLFAKLFQSKDLGDLITNVGAGGGGGAPAAAGGGGGGGGGGGAAEEDKKEESEAEEEEDEDMGFSLFD